MLDRARRRNRDLRLRTARLGADRLDCLHDVQALGNLAEHDVLAVEPRRDHRRDEELQTDAIIQSALPPCMSARDRRRRTCDPFVLAPALAMDSRPGLSCRNLKFSSEQHSFRPEANLRNAARLTRELLPVDRLASGTVMTREVAALEHELQRVGQHQKRNNNPARMPDGDCSRSGLYGGKCCRNIRSRAGPSPARGNSVQSSGQRRRRA